MIRLLLDARHKEQFHHQLEKYNEAFVEKKAMLEDDDFLTRNFRFSVIGSTAIVPVHGCIFHRMSLMCWFFDGTACTELMTILDKLSNHPQIKRIVLDINSPGGTVEGIETCGDFIYALRSKVEIIAYVNTMACSAAYWLAAACEKRYVSESSAEVGSIGVIVTHMSYEKLLEKEGILVTHIHAGENKTLGTPYKDLSEDERLLIQEDIDEIYNVFVSKMSLFLGISEEEIRKTEASVYMPKDAKNKKLIDGQHTLSELLAMEAKSEEQTEDDEEKKAEGEEDEEPKASEGEDDDETKAEGEEDEEPKASESEEEDDDEDKDKKAFNSGVRHEITRQKKIREIVVPGMEKFMNKFILDPDCTPEAAMAAQTKELQRKGGVKSLADKYGHVNTTRGQNEQSTKSLASQVREMIPPEKRKESFKPLGKHFTRG